MIKVSKDLLHNFFVEKYLYNFITIFYNLTGIQSCARIQILIVSIVSNIILWYCILSSFHLFHEADGAKL